ncbi:MAG: hypothetical protein KF753_23485 [Caldilineaceae bacterium]|nr:hypothetical protein [Caldilineaceae bacterium]
MADPRAPPVYRIFLLTVWQEAPPLPGSRPDWRFRLEDTRSGAHWGFISPEALVAALAEGLPEEGEGEDRG